jgi:hypothetical protein
LEDLVVAAYFRPPFDHGVRTDSGTGGNGHVFANYDKGTDFGTIVDTGSRMYNSS